MTTTITEVTTRTEWGVRYTWPDGHSEVQNYRESRREAAAHARMTNSNQDNPAVAEVVTRQVTVTDWAEVQS